MRCAYVLFILLILAASCAAQQGTVADVYVTQFSGISSQVEKIMAAGTEHVSMQQRVTLHGQAFALIKSLHRLEESAAEENLTIEKRRESPDKNLLLIQRGCEALALSLNAWDDYLSTSDRAFLLISNEAKSTSDRIRQMMSK